MRESESEAQFRRVVESLRESEQRLQFFLDHAPGALAMLDRELRYLAVNRRWQAEYTRPGESLIGRSHYDVYPGPDPSRGATRTGGAWPARRTRGRAGARDAARRRRPSGCAGKCSPGTTRPARVGGIVLFVEDITARVESEEAARAARQDLAELIATIDGIVWEADAHTFALHLRQRAGRAAARLSGQRLAGRTRTSGPRTSTPTIATHRSSCASISPRRAATTSSTTG